MRICLVGATHPCHNPRLVREADSLVAQGHEVHVVSCSLMPELVERDLRLVKARGWRLQQVHIFPTSGLGRFRSVHMRARSHLARAAFPFIRALRFAEHSCCAAVPELLELAVSEPADWFIAHTQPALPIAATAARFWGAHLGFDCEDLLSAGNAAEAKVMRTIERAYLPACRYVSVPSPAIAAHLEQEYQIASPTVLYNVFPLQHAGRVIAPRHRPVSPRLRLHWLGQSIGPGKGIEEAFAAVALLSDRAELHIRGMQVRDHVSFIQSLERRYGLKAKVYPLVHHDELVGTMDQFDVGLALERPDDGLYSVTVTNKVFLYLLAGLAIAATDTVGQRQILQQIPAAGFLYPAGKPELLAEKLRNWLNYRHELLAAQQAAWDAARARFCWDLEEAKFLQLVGASPHAVGQSTNNVGQREARGS